MQGIAGLKRAHAQLTEFDDRCWTPHLPGREHPTRTVPGLRYRYGLDNAYRKASADNWCAINLFFGPEGLTVWDHAAPSRPGRIGHRLYSKQGLHAQWLINSADGEFNKNIEGIILKAVLPLEEYEQELGGRVIKNNQIKVY